MENHVDSAYILLSIEQVVIPITTHVPYLLHVCALLLMAIRLLQVLALHQISLDLPLIF